LGIGLVGVDIGDERREFLSLSREIFRFDVDSSEKYFASPSIAAKDIVFIT
jgi:hypothetical protein